MAIIVLQKLLLCYENSTKTVNYCATEINYCATEINYCATEIAKKWLFWAKNGYF